MKAPPTGQILLIKFLGRVDAEGVSSAGIFLGDKKVLKKKLMWCPDGAY